MIKDKLGENVSLEDMTLSGVEDFASMLLELKELLVSSDVKNPKFSLENGSAQIKLEIDDQNGDLIFDGYTTLRDGNSENRIVLKFWNKVRSVVKNGEGSSMQVTYKSVDGQIHDLTKDLIEGSRFRLLRIAQKTLPIIHFKSGLIEQTGGSSVINIHLATEDKKITIGCSKIESKLLAQQLWDEVHVSFVEFKDRLHKSNFDLIDTYDSIQRQDYFKNLYKQIYELDSNSKRIQALELLTDAFREILISNQTEYLIHLILMFKHESIPLAFLKTITLNLRFIQKGRSERLDQICVDFSRLYLAVRSKYLKKMNYDKK